MDLQHTLSGLKATSGRALFEQNLDIRTEKFRGPVAGLTNEMKMPRVPVGVLEAEPALPEVDLPSDAGIDHPLMGPIHRRATDLLVFLTHQVDQIVRAEVPVLPEKHANDQLAFAGALATGRAQTFEVVGSGVHATRRRPGNVRRRTKSHTRRWTWRSGS